MNWGVRNTAIAIGITFVTAIGVYLAIRFIQSVLWVAPSAELVSRADILLISEVREPNVCFQEAIRLPGREPVFPGLTRSRHYVMAGRLPQACTKS
jgi:hypothetical protein